MTAAEALDWTQKTFGKKHGPHIRKSIENLTKFDLPDYLDGSLKEKFEQSAKSPQPLIKPIEKKEEVKELRNMTGSEKIKFLANQKK